MLGHVSGFDVCRKLLKLPPSSSSCPNPVCEWCAVFKSKRRPFPQETVSRAARVIYRLHSDLSGIKVKSLSGFMPVLHAILGRLLKKSLVLSAN